MSDLAAVVSALADGQPFGSFEYLSSRCGATYVELLSSIVQQSPAAKELLRALDGRESTGVLGDPLVRRTIEDGVCTFIGGLDAIDPDTLDAVLQLAAQHALRGSGAVVGDTGRCVPFATGLGEGVVWADDEPGTPAGRRFVTEVLKRLRGFRIHVPTDEQAQAVADGYRLALDVAPDLARSSLSHLRVVVIGDFEGQAAPINALTVPGLPG